MKVTVILIVVAALLVACGKKAPPRPITNAGPAFTVMGSAHV